MKENKYMERIVAYIKGDELKFTKEVIAEGDVIGVIYLTWDNNQLILNNERVGGKREKK